MIALFRSSALRRLGILYARLALGAAFLSAVADRFGLWGSPGHPYVAWGDFAHFVRYTAQVNSFLPGAVIPALAWVATIAEFCLGILLILGIWQRWTAIVSALLLALFGIAMSISLGIKAPLNFSVFSASAAALLLSLHPTYDDGRSKVERDDSGRQR